MLNQRLDEWFGLLSFVRMFGTCVDFEFLDHGSTELVAWKHALDCMFDNKFGFFGAHLIHADVAFATHPARVEHVALIGILLARDLDLLGIDDHDEIACIGMRRVDRLVATAKHVGNFYGYATKCFIGSIDDVPAFGMVRFSS